jgi:hypothetical protein
MKSICCTCLIFWPLAAALAAEPAAPLAPSVEKIDATHYRINQISFDQARREIRFPAKLNMAEGLLEFLVVHETGKLHESLFSTEVMPSQLNLAFILLRYPASRELYFLPNQDGGYTNDVAVVAPEIQAAARLLIEVEWLDGAVTKRVAVNDWIQHTTTTQQMPPGPWVYGASEFEHEKYAPDITGDIAAIFTTNSAMINFPGTDNRDDNVWSPYLKRVPAVGTAVTLIISPFSK